MPANDPALSAFLRAADAHARQHALESLIVERVRPLTTRVLARFRNAALNGHDLDDVIAAVDLRVARRLEKLGGTPDDAIEHFDDYVAVVAYNAAHDVLRRRKAEHETEEIGEITTDATPESGLIAREDVEALWDEVKELPPNQRAALLLNLRDSEGNNALALLVLTRIATFDALAASLGMTPERLAELWSALPLDDRTIASMLGLTRQQVINLRKAARARLARRTSGGHNAPFPRS